MQLSQVLITPSIAKKYLLLNNLNRKLSLKVVSRYADMMLSGDWNEGSPCLIAFGENGDLLDGQHRLQAIIDADVSLKMIVANGCSDDSYKSIDTGKARKITDTFFIEGVGNPSLISSGVHCYVKYLRSIKDKTKNNRGKVEPKEASSVLKENKYFHAVTEYYKENRNTLSIFRPGAFIASSVIFNKIDSSDADEFMKMLSCEIKVDSKHPVSVLTERMRRDSQGRYKLPSEDILLLIVKCWNAWRAGDYPKFYKINEKLRVKAI